MDVLTPVSQFKKAINAALQESVSWTFRLSYFTFSNLSFECNSIINKCKLFLTNTIQRHPCRLRIMVFSDNPRSAEKFHRHRSRSLRTECPTRCLHVFHMLHSYNSWTNTHLQMRWASKLVCFFSSFNAYSAINSWFSLLFTQCILWVEKMAALSPASPQTAGHVRLHPQSWVSDSRCRSDSSVPSVLTSPGRDCVLFCFVFYDLDDLLNINVTFYNGTESEGLITSGCSE